MGNNTQKMKEIISPKDDFIINNIVNVCKNTIVSNSHKYLQNYNEADLPG